MKNNNIVITGIGIIAPNGCGKEHFWRSLESGCSGIKPIKMFSTKLFKSKTAAQIDNFNAEDFIEKKGSKKPNRSAALLCSAAKLALEDAGIVIKGKNVDEIGVCVATTLTNLRSFVKFSKNIFKGEPLFVDPALFPETLLNLVSSELSIYFNIQGFNTTISTGFTASLDAVKYASVLIRSGHAKCVLVGAVEEITPWSFEGFYRAGFLSGAEGREVSRPFDLRRNGAVMGEGAAAIILEDERYAVRRKANIYASILGQGSYFGNKTEGMQKSILKAMKNASVSLEAIDYISASANSTQQLDAMESVAINKVFKKCAAKVPVSSIKSMVGEIYSAAGLFQVIGALGMIKRKFIAPNINYKKKDPACDLKVVANKSIHRKIKTVLINNFSFAGNNTCAIIAGHN